jgi:hypothetical protein
VFSGFTNKAPNGPPNFPFAGLGPITFDGKGNISGSLIIGPTSTGTAVWPVSPGVLGTYTVNADCTGLFNGLNGVDNFAFVIVSGGAEIFMVNLSPGQVFAVDVKRM